MSIHDARDGLQRSALAYAADKTKGNELALEASARDFVKAQSDAATGVTAAVFQANADKKRGAKLCPTCSEKVVPATDRNGAVRWLDGKSFQPHFCKVRR